MDSNEARRRIKQGGSDPTYRRTNEYKDAVKYTNAHYKGMLRGAQNLGSGGAETRKGCSLWTCLVLVLPIAAAAASVWVLR